MATLLASLVGGRSTRALAVINVPVIAWKIPIAALLYAIAIGGVVMLVGSELEPGFRRNEVALAPLILAAVASTALGVAVGLWLGRSRAFRDRKQFLNLNSLYFVLGAFVGFVALAGLSELVGPWPYAVWFFPMGLASVVMLLAAQRVWK